MDELAIGELVLTNQGFCTDALYLGFADRIKRSPQAQSPPGDAR